MEFCFKAILIFLAVNEVVTADGSDSSPTSNHNLVYQMLSTMRDQLDSQQQQIQQLQNQRHEYENKFKSQQQQIQDLQQKLVSKTEYDEFKTTMNQKLQDFSENLQSESKKYVFNEFGCSVDEITLTCPTETLINVTYATYGQHNQPCDDECCAPYPLDCTELVIENDFANWLSLKLACDNTSTCTYLFEGAIINDCGENYPADYMQIFYDCLPESTDDPIGFTARASTTQSYLVGDVIIFDDVLTNYGNGYDPETNFFTCPRHGLYLFGGTVYANPQSVNAELMIDNVKILESYAHDEDERSTSSTVQVIVQCYKGQIVWMTVGWDTQVQSNSSAQTIFFGVLVHNV